jgi:hypothetical protein
MCSCGDQSPPEIWFIDMLFVIGFELPGKVVILKVYTPPLHSIPDIGVVVAHIRFII